MKPEIHATSYLDSLPDNSKSARAEREKQATTQAPAKTEEKHVEKVVRGKTKIKKNELRKFTDVFISEDVGRIKEYIINDLLIPTIKKTLYDAVVNSFDIALFGGRSGGSGSRRPIADSVSYTNYGRSGRRESESGSRASNRHSYDDIIFDTRSDAEAVLARMDEMMDVYEIVSVADMFEMADLSCDYTDNKYGWTNIRNAEVVRVRDGYKIKMPKAVPIR